MSGPYRFRYGPDMYRDDERPDPVGEVISQLVAERVRTHHERVERACEESLVGGMYGVIIDGDMVWVDPRVRYGHILDVTLCGVDAVDWWPEEIRNAPRRSALMPDVCSCGHSREVHAVTVEGRDWCYRCECWNFTFPEETDRNG